MSTMDLLAKVRSLKELETLISEAQTELDSTACAAESFQRIFTS